MRSFSLFCKSVSLAAAISMLLPLSVGCTRNDDVRDTSSDLAEISTSPVDDVTSAADTADTTGIVDDDDNSDMPSHPSGNLPTLTVDMSNHSHDIVHGSAGFLYGISDEGVPDVNTLMPLRPKVLATKGALGTEHPYGDALDVAVEFFEAGGEQVQMYCSNYYGVFGVTADAHDYGDVLENVIAPAVVEWKNGVRERFPDIDSRIVYIPINEGTPVNGVANFNAAWKIYYDAIKSADPGASVAGPNDAVYRGHDGMREFLSFCVKNDCMPDVITWHELSVGSLSTMDDHINDYRRICGELDIDEAAVVINEYADFADCGVPGRLVNWIARLEDCEVYGCLPFWHQANNLNDLAAGTNQGNGAWWVYKWYGDMSGETLRVSSKNTTAEGLYGVAASDGAKRSVSAIFGGADGSIEIELDALDKSDIFGSADRVHVKIEATYFTGYHGALYEPSVVLDGVYPVKGGKVSVCLDDAVFSTAYRLTVTCTDEAVSTPAVGAYRAVYEAEDAEFSGSVIIDSQESPLEYPKYFCSGGMRVGGIDSDGDGITYTVYVPVDGLYRLDFIYGNGVGSTRNNSSTHKPKNISQSLSVDGAVSELYLPNTLFYSMEGSTERYYDLKAGYHTVSVMFSGDAGGFHDALYVTYAGAYGCGEPSYNKVFEAEDAVFLDGGEHSPAAGEECVILPAQNNDDARGGVRFLVDVGDGGIYHMIFRCRAGHDGAVRVFIDNTNVTFDSLAAKADVSASDEWQDVPVTLYLRRGINIVDVGADVDIELDCMRVFESGLDLTETVEAEDADGVFSTSESDGVVYVSEMDADGEYLEFHVNTDRAGLYKLGFSYSNDDLCGTHSYNIKIVDRDAAVYVNGTLAAHLFFSNTFSDDTFLEKVITVALDEGDNVIRVCNDDRRHVLWGGSQSTPGTNVLDNFTPNFDYFTVTPATVDEAPEKIPYNVSVSSTDGGHAVADVNEAADGDTVNISIIPEGELVRVTANGRDVTDSVTPDGPDAYTVTFDVDGSDGGDVEVFVEFSMPEYLTVDVPESDSNVVEYAGRSYTLTGENMFSNGDFSDNSGTSMEQWYVGVNSAGHPTSGARMRPSIRDDGALLNMMPLSESGLLVTDSYEPRVSGNKFYFGEDLRLPDGCRHYLVEAIGEPWTSNAWNGEHSLIAFVRLEPHKDYYFSFSAYTQSGSASVRYGAVDMDSYVPNEYRIGDTLDFSGSGYFACNNGDMQNVGGDWRRYESVINSGDGDYFIFNAYWLQMCEYLCLGDFKLYRAEPVSLSKAVYADDPMSVSVGISGDVSLPDTVTVHTNDGKAVGAGVVWSDKAADIDTTAPGVYVVYGYAVLPDGLYSDGAVTVRARIVVRG